jgi:hypothetical protein
MQHYYGIKALCKRLGIKSYCGLRLQVVRYKIPIYKRRCRIGKMKFASDILYSNDLLLMTWELDQARMTQETWISDLDKQLDNRRVAHRQRRAGSSLPCRSYKRQYLDNSAA